MFVALSVEFMQLEKCFRVIITVVGWPDVVCPYDCDYLEIRLLQMNLVKVSAGGIHPY